MFDLRPYALIGDAERVGIIRDGQTLIVAMIEQADFFEPGPGPVGQLGPSREHGQEVATDMGPTKSEDDFTGLHLGHGLVGAVAIDAGNAFGVVAQVPFRNVVRTERIEHKDDRLLGGKDPEHPDEADLVGTFDKHQPAGFVAMPMLFTAIVFAEVFVKRLEEGHEFLQAVSDGAGGQIETVATQFGEDAV